MAFCCFNATRTRKCFMLVRNRQYYAWKAQIYKHWVMGQCVCVCAHGIWWNITIIQHEIRFSIRAGVITKEWILYQRHAAKRRVVRLSTFYIYFLCRLFCIRSAMMRPLLLFTSPLLCVIFGFYILISPQLHRISVTFSFPLLFLSFFAASSLHLFAFSFLFFRYSFLFFYRSHHCHV